LSIIVVRLVARWYLFYSSTLSLGLLLVLLFYTRDLIRSPADRT
jgi:hypothetical protein